MNKAQALMLLARELEAWRGRSYDDLASLVGAEPATGEVSGEKGSTFYLEFEVFWDRKPGGDLRVMGAIDDGGIRAFVPLTDSFILAPDGSFVGEDHD